MKRFCSLSVGVGLLAISLCVGSGSTVCAQAVYDLTIGGPNSLSGAVDDVVSAEYTCSLTHSGDAAPSGGGAQGWSLSLSADDISIVGVRTGIPVPGGETPLTDAAALFNGGFEKSEVTTAARAGSGCEGKDGAVSAVVLSFTSGATLPATSTSSIAVLDVEATIPAALVTAKLFYVDGCKGVGQPVDNNVTHDGASVKPSLGEKNVELIPPGPSCAGELALGFSAAPVRVVGGDPMLLIDELVGTGEEGDEGVIEVSAASATIYAGIISPYEEGGALAVQGWSLAVALEGDADFLPAPDAPGVGDTAGAPVADGGYESGGFVQTQVVDPAREPTSGPLAGLGAQGKGTVSAVVLSFTTGATLPALGVESVLKIPVQLASGDLGTEAVLRFKSGLQGIGQPVSNVATVAGETAQYCNPTTSVTIKIGGPAPSNPFIRGNPNNDGKVNIADPIWIVNELFRAGPETLCQDAADANDDGSVDVSDVTFLIDYLFRGGSVPSAPFPACGPDPEGEPDEDGVTCGETQDVCS